MNQSNKDLFFNFTQLRLITAVLSLLMSGMAFYFDDIINSDGILYMDMVETYLQDGLTAMAGLYNWPFFSMLVAWLSKALSLPAQLSASVLNSLLFVVFTDALLLISAKLLPNRRQILLAALLILCFFTINNYRDFIIRDIGYWAFCMLAFYQLLRYQDEPKLSSALFWQLFGGIAFLFRIEAAVLILLMPLAFVSAKNIKSSLKHLLPLYSAVIPLSGVATFVILNANGLSAAFDKIAEYMAYLNSEVMMSRIDRDLTLFEDKILSPFSAEYSGLILFSGLMVMLLYKLAADISISYLIMLGLTLRERTRGYRHPYKRLLTWFILINLLILVAFLFRQYFVISRYCIMAVTGIFLLLLPRFTQLIESSWEQRRYWFTGFLGFLLLASVIDTYHQTNSKTYIRKTAIWASHNLQAKDRVLTDDKFIHYYIHRERTAVSSTFRHQGLGNYRPFDYVIVVDKQRHPEQLKHFRNIELELIYQQQNRRGNTASIYRVNHVNPGRR